MPLLLIFLQNAWGVEDGYIPTYDRPSFANCMTGKRLKTMFPEDTEICIRNCTPAIGKVSDSNIKADPQYIQDQIETIHPDAILACGKNARIIKSEEIPVIYAPHPTWRKFTKEHAAQIKKEVSVVLNLC
jgi:hypothetical protein